MENTKKKTTIEAAPNRPYMVKGDVEILDENGKVLSNKPTVFLCSCGHSGNKPFCDGTHKTLDKD